MKDVIDKSHCNKINRKISIPAQSSVDSIEHHQLQNSYISELRNPPRYFYADN
jgi:hypothetical protein